MHWVVVWDGATGRVLYRAEERMRTGVPPQSQASSIAVGPTLSMADLQDIGG